MRRSMLTLLAISALLLVVTVTPAIGKSDANAVAQAIYADGSVGCAGADDLSDRVGRVVLRPVDGGVSFHVVLTDGAHDWNYYLELSLDGTCQDPERFTFTTDSNGHGLINGVYAADPGMHVILVDIVSDPHNNIPPNPMHREMAPGGLLQITVP